MDRKKFIVGLGCGRCGTTSLTYLLNKQIGAYITHEGFVSGEFALSWENDDEYMKFCMIKYLQYNVPIIGDVGYYWINYVPQTFSYMDNAYFICMKRQKEEVMESFLKYKPNAKLIAEMNEQQLSDYYDKYYEEAERKMILYPHNFEIFDISDLNSMGGQAKILGFCGIETQDAIYELPLHKNKHAGKGQQNG